MVLVLVAVMSLVFTTDQPRVAYFFITSSDTALLDELFGCSGL
jgi:hypothetical protein